MKAVINNYNSKQRFTVIIKEDDLNKNGDIYPHILLENLEKALIKPVKQIEKARNIVAKRSSCVYKVDILGNAQLDDRINIQIQLGKYDNESVIFHLNSYREETNGKNANLICKASFSYNLKSKENSPKMAS